MANMKKCDTCGYVMSSNMTQCPNCGRRFNRKEDFELPSLKHPKVEEDTTIDFEKIVSKPRTKSTSHTMTSLNLEEVLEEPVFPQEEVEERLTETEVILPVSTFKDQNEELDDLFNLDETKRETPVGPPPIKVYEEPKRTKPKKKKGSKIVNAIASILLFVFLTAAVFGVGIFAVDYFTGESFVNNIKAILPAKEVVKTQVAVTPTPSAEPTPEASVQPTVDTTEVVEEVTNPDGSLGHLVITDGPIYTRSAPSTSGDSYGSVQIGEEYEVYEIAQADSYTWYRIGDGVWVPTDGTWMDYNPY